MNNPMKPSFGLPTSLAAALRQAMNDGNRLMSLAAQRMREQHAQLRSQGLNKDNK